jgi:hypothetical protein
MNLIIACQLMKAFVDNFEDPAMTPVGRPWSWAAASSASAKGVEAALENLGVRKESRKVLVAEDKENILADQTWARYQRASQWGGGTGIPGNLHIVGTLPAMARLASSRDSVSQRRKSNCIIM